MDTTKMGQLIRESRMEKGLTQQALAEAVNVSATAVSKWENGHSLPDIAMLEPLSSALDLSISELVLGERSDDKVSDNMVREPGADKQEAAIKSVIGESVRQRKKAVLKWVLVTLAAIAVAFAAFLFLFEIGLPAKQDNISVKTEIQNNDGHPEWVIHFQTLDGRPLHERTEATYISTDDGNTVNGVILHLRTAPLGHLNPDGFTWGYSIEKDEGHGLVPSEDHDFLVIVDYGDGEVTYSMREEGMFQSGE